LTYCVCREVHSSDLSRIGEMPNTNPEGLVHWAKFTHLGNNIREIHSFQERIRENGDYGFASVPGLAKLILETELLDMEVRWFTFARQTIRLIAL
jgi:hypothetical protein